MTYARWIPYNSFNLMMRMAQREVQKLPIRLPNCCRVFLWMYASISLIPVVILCLGATHKFHVAQSITALYSDQRKPYSLGYISLSRAITQ